MVKPKRIVLREDARLVHRRSFKTSGITEGFKKYGHLLDVLRGIPLEVVEELEEGCRVLIRGKDGQGEVHSYVVFFPWALIDTQAKIT